LIEQRGRQYYSLEEWKTTWMHTASHKTLFISAIDKKNLNEFRQEVYKAVREIHISRFPYNHFLYPEITEEQQI
jgi:GTP-binding protein HflX